MTSLDWTQRLTRIYTITLPKGRTSVGGRALVQLERRELMFFPSDGALPERAAVPPDMVSAIQEWIAACEAAEGDVPLPERVRIFLAATLGLRVEAPAGVEAGLLTATPNGGVDPALTA